MARVPTLQDDLNDGGYGGNFYVHRKKEGERFAYRIKEIREDYVENSNASVVVLSSYSLKKGNKIEARDVDGFERLYLKDCLKDKRTDNDLAKKIMDLE